MADVLLFHYGIAIACPEVSKTWVVFSDSYTSQ
jgi:hypothetical protein